jgi:hypothetical protein
MVSLTIPAKAGIQVLQILMIKILREATSSPFEKGRAEKDSKPALPLDLSPCGRGTKGEGE